MDTDKMQTVFVIGIAVVVLAAAIVLNLDVTGNAVQGPYKCVRSGWPERIVVTDGFGDMEYNCPGEKPYCNDNSAAAGSPECCMFRQTYGSSYLYSGCEAMGADVQTKAGTAA